MARSPLLPPPAAAEYLGFKVSTLKAWRVATRKTGKQVGPRWVKEGDGPKAYIRYRLVDLDRHIDAGLRGAA